uniref:Lipase domain-containing protein n=1 Tax=Rhodnius prolixus TaxID=13249 RepID=T1HJV2_RHOPR
MIEAVSSYRVFLVIFTSLNSIYLVESDKKLQCPPASNFIDNYTQFFICKRSIGKDQPVIYAVQTENLETSMITSSPLIVVIGDMFDTTTPLNDPIVKAYLFRGSDNIVYVQHLLTFQKIYCPFSYTQIIAQTLNDFLLKIYSINSKVTPNNTHLIGLGMGAVIAGQAALDIPHVKFNRLTGLDPTLFFSSIPSDPYVYPLRPSLTDFTDVYHTNVGMIGRFDIMGDVDIYFNNDVQMPGCNKSNLCSHKKAAEYYAEAVYSLQGMWGIPCYAEVALHFHLNQNILCKFCSNINDMVLVGEYMSYNLRGAFKVLTNSEPPYTNGKFIKILYI